MDWETTVAPTGSLVPSATARESLSLPDEVDAPTLDLRLAAVTEALDGPDSLTGRCFLRRTIRVQWEGWARTRPVPGGAPVTLAPPGVRYQLSDGSFADARGVTVGSEFGTAFLRFGTRPLDYVEGCLVEAVYEAGSDVVPAEVQVLALSLLRTYDEHQTTILGIGEGKGDANPAMESILQRYDARRLLSPEWGD